MSAERPSEVPTQWGEPTQAANSDSKAFTSSPRTYQPESITLAAAAFSSAAWRALIAFKSRKGMIIKSEFAEDFGRVAGGYHSGGDGPYDD
jgi:hypothetical protein